MDLPTTIGQSTTVDAHGKTLRVTRTARTSFTARIIAPEASQRARWGDAAQIREDVAYFLTTGNLPRESSPSWA